MKIYFSTARTDFIKEMADVASIFLGQVTVLSTPDDFHLQVNHEDHIIGIERQCTIKLSGSYETETSNRELIREDAVEEKRLHKRQVKNALYSALKKATGIQPPWGSLTGIRPTRLAYEAMAKGKNLDEALFMMQGTFDVIPPKTELMGHVIREQQALMHPQENEVDIYFGIPFCESRCRYCSFISSQVGNGTKLAPYVEALVREIEATINLVKEKELKPRAIYMGGGTPTALDAALLDKVLTAAEPMLRVCHESTVEAGRPDSITKEKLLVLKKHQIGRISINPQTIHDQTLQLIGRAHTHLQTEKAYDLARSMGFLHINMDLIIGLPGESVDMFRQTLRWTKAISPESLTIHSLCIKRSSDMHKWEDCLPNAKTVEAMVYEGFETALDMGMRPYYLYRQKHMAGNLENVGYAKPSMACLYNVDTMEDTLSVLAMGAGAISKRVTPGRAMVCRAPNLKQIDEYIERVDEMIQRKRMLFL